MKDFPEFEIFQDYNGDQIKFQYAFIDVGNCYSLKAIEDSKNDPVRIFSAYDNVNPVNTLIKIRKTIKEELNKRYFTESEDNHRYEPRGKPRPLFPPQGAGYYTFRFCRDYSACRPHEIASLSCSTYNY